MKCLLVFCFIFLIIQVGKVYSKYTFNHEVENSIHSTFGMYRKLYDESQNFVFSPLSFRIIYSILYQTSSSGSETELKNLLFDVTKEVPQKSNLVSVQSQNIADLQKSSNIRFANKIYASNNIQLKSNFRSLVARYLTAIEQVDFMNGGNTDIANHMNYWVGNQTNGLIKNLVEPSSITSDVQLFLINTIYFKADWLVPFSKFTVRPKLFKSIDGAQKLIDAIQNTDYYKLSFNDELNVDVLELPYAHESNFAFWIILPRPNLSLSQLIDNLSVEFMTKIKETLNFVNAEIQFPIFEIESAIDGQRITPGIFTKEEFDIVEDNLSSVDAIKQKAKIIVNTKGTEAAAGTYVKMTPLSLPAPRPLPKLFKVDHPFIYAIISDTTKEPIFIGHYTKA